jgi:hypothetical protein
MFSIPTRICYREYPKLLKINPEKASMILKMNQKAKTFNNITPESIELINIINRLLFEYHKQFTDCPKCYKEVWRQHYKPFKDQIKTEVYYKICSYFCCKKVLFNKKLLLDNIDPSLLDDIDDYSEDDFRYKNLDEEEKFYIHKLIENKKLDNLLKNTNIILLVRKFYEQEENKRYFTCVPLIEYLFRCYKIFGRIFRKKRLTNNTIKPISEK